MCVCVCVCVCACVCVRACVCTCVAHLGLSADSASLSVWQLSQTGQEKAFSSSTPTTIPTSIILCGSLYLHAGSILIRGVLIITC